MRTLSSNNSSARRGTPARSSATPQSFNITSAPSLCSRPSSCTCRALLEVSLGLGAASVQVVGESRGTQQRCFGGPPLLSLRLMSRPR
jgi:hypothetical protein